MLRGDALEITDRAPVKDFLCWIAPLSWLAVAALAETSHDFGKVPPGGQWTHVFVFTNTLDHSLQFTAADHSCSCLVVEDWPRVVESGRTGKVSVRFYAASAKGVVTESVRLKSAGSDSANVGFTVTALVQAPVEASPDFIVLKADPAGLTNAFAYIQITNHLSTPVMLTNVTSSSDRFSTKLVPIQAGRSYRLRVEAVPPFNSGNTFGVFQIKTSVPEYPRLEITAMVPAAK